MPRAEPYLATRLGHLARQEKPVPGLKAAMHLKGRGNVLAHILSGNHKGVYRFFVRELFGGRYK